MVGSTMPASSWDCPHANRTGRLSSPSSSSSSRSSAADEPGTLAQAGHAPNGTSVRIQITTIGSEAAASTHITAQVPKAKGEMMESRPPSKSGRDSHT